MAGWIDDHAPTQMDALGDERRKIIAEIGQHGTAPSSIVSFEDTGCYFAISDARAAGRRPSRTSLLRSLAPAPFDAGAGHVAFEQALGHLRAAIHQLARAGAQRLAAFDELHVAVHLLEFPAERMRDERKLRHEKANFAEEHHHLTGHGLDAVLAARDDDGGDLVADQD